MEFNVAFMKMGDRKPRETRFEAENHEARLARLKEQAPTLGTNRRLRLYAIFGSILVLLTVAAFYMTVQIYKAVIDRREENALIEVDQAPDIPKKESEKALERIEAEEAAAQREFEEQLEALKQVDLLEELEEPGEG